MSSLQNKTCLPCEGIGEALAQEEIKHYLQQLSDWKLNEDNKKIFKNFQFKNFYHTMHFVNAIAWMANLENHHPILEISYNYCLVHYSTHALHGLSVNDFICAAKIDLIYKPYKEKYHDR